MTKPQKNILLSLGIFSVILLLVGVFFIIPSIEEMIKDSESFLRGKERAAVLEQRANNLDKIEQETAKMEEGMKRYINSFINEEYPIEFITFLENMAYVEKLEIDINPLSVSKEEEKASEFLPLAFQLSLSGTYNGFARFLEKLESSKLMIKIDGFNIAQSSSNSKSEKFIRAELNFKVYKQKQ